MSILSDTAILKAIENGSIVITPFNEEQLGGNSYDVRLSDTLLVYDEMILDCRLENNTTEIKIPEDGLVLYPNTLYLASTIERTETYNHVPYLDGKSSIGRLGIAIHQTAGRGDCGFCGTWTMEITVVHPVRVYAGMKIGQITFHTVKGKVKKLYNKKPDAKYNNQTELPVASKMYKNF
jgi:dCTP deaminase